MANAECVYIYNNRYKLVVANSCAYGIIKEYQHIYDEYCLDIMKLRIAKNSWK